MRRRFLEKLIGHGVGEAKEVTSAARIEKQQYLLRECHEAAHIKGKPGVARRRK